MTQSLSWNLSQNYALENSFHTSISQPAVITKFDPQLGSLKKVEVYRDGGMANAYVYASNPEEQSAAINLNFAVNGYFSPNPEESQTGLWFAVYGGGSSIIPSSQPREIFSGGGSSEEGGGLEKTFTGLELDVFKGIGNIDYAPSLDVFVLLYTLDPQLVASLEIAYNFDYRVTYFYDVAPVPLPAAAFMFAPALLGFLGLRRKAKLAA